MFLSGEEMKIIFAFHKPFLLSMSHLGIICVTHTFFHNTKRIKVFFSQYSPGKSYTL